MTEHITVYAYNVLFGDAILVEVPDGGQKRFILIDVGNVLAGEGGKDSPLLDALSDVAERTSGRVDLYVMTHEHLDHVQGLRYAADNGVTLRADHVWMTASAAPDYYDTHENARKKKLDLMEAVHAFAAVLGAEQVPPSLAAIFAMNLKTDDYVEHIRSQLAAEANVHYVHREQPLDGLHAFTEATFRLLAPEEDTSAYYGSRHAHLAQPAAAAASGAKSRPIPLPGVDAGAFYQLIDRMNTGLLDSLLAIDKAANDTSIVFEMSWRGRRLLFPGDAEQGSWRMMADKTDLQPVDLLKVGHHGSRNATPPPEILDLVLPPARRDQAVALVSTCAHVYPGVPDEGVEALLEARTSTIRRTTEATPGKPLIVTIEEG